MLDRGDRVALAARRPADVDDLARRFPGRALALRLDVTIAEEREAAVAAAIATFGCVDVLVNNAGYGLLGAVEEVEETKIRTQIETNFFGPLALM